jgi:hypothetical protein
MKTFGMKPPGGAPGTSAADQEKIQKEKEMAAKQKEQKRIEALKAAVSRTPLTFVD